MKIKIIDYSDGKDMDCFPVRSHYNDAGADVKSTETIDIVPGETVKIPLGFGLDLPDGFAGYIFPRSGLSSIGIVCELPPIDSGYKGEVHAIVTNVGTDVHLIEKGDRIGQLVIMPVITADFVTSLGEERGVGAFASTGR